MCVLAVFVQLVEQLLVSKGHKKFAHTHTHTETLAESESSRTARKYKERHLTVIN